MFAVRFIVETADFLYPTANIQGITPPCIIVMVILLSTSGTQRERLYPFSIFHFSTNIFIL